MLKAKRPYTKLKNTNSDHYSKINWSIERRGMWAGEAKKGTKGLSTDRKN